MKTINELKEVFGYEPTEEQKEVIFNEGKNVVCTAYPGTGKTSTILMDCFLRPEEKKIILAFNKDIKEEIQREMKLLGIKNTRVYTTHSLAYKFEARNNFGRNFKYNNFNIYSIAYHNDFTLNMFESKILYNAYISFLRSKETDSKNFLKGGYFNNSIIVKNQLIGEIKKLYNNLEGQKVINLSDEKKIYKLLSLEDDENSSETDLSKLFKKKERVKKKIKNNFNKLQEIKLIKDFEKTIIENLIDKYSKLILKTFEKMQGEVNDNNKKNKLPQTHDHYLKAFSLSDKTFENIDKVYLDEAHDTNEVTTSMIFNKFPNAIHKVFGDPNQAIYKWRGAVNALETFKEIGNVKKVYLTWSYRYGERIAEKANILLKITDNLINGKEIIGKNKNENLSEPFPKEEQVLVIGRTNLGLVKFALQQKGQRVFFENRIDTKIYDDIKRLKEYDIDDIKSKNIKKYESFSKLEKAIDEGLEVDQEVRMTTKLVQDLGIFEIDKMINVLNKNYKKKDCKFVCTTVHKSKGLENDNVIKLNDFVDIYKLKDLRKDLKEELNNPNLKQKEIQNLKKEIEKIEEEINLHYVAITRCKKRFKEKEI